jgi:hypothetical protein
VIALDGKRRPLGWCQGIRYSSAPDWIASITWLVISSNMERMNSPSYAERFNCRGEEFLLCAFNAAGQLGSSLPLNSRPYSVLTRGWETQLQDSFARQLESQ